MSRWDVLALLDDGPLPTAQLAHLARISRAAAYTALWKLERAGCVRRRGRINRCIIWEPMP